MRDTRTWALENHLCKACGGRILRCVNGNGITGGGNPVFKCADCGKAVAAMGPEELCWCGFSHRGNRDNAYTCQPFSILDERPELLSAFRACGCGRDVLSSRPDALYATSACRAKAARARAGTALLSEREVRLIREAARRLQPDPLAPDLLAIADRARQMRLALRGKGPQKAHVRLLGGDRLGGGAAPCS